MIFNHRFRYRVRFERPPPFGKLEENNARRDLVWIHDTKVTFYHWTEENWTHRGELSLRDWARGWGRGSNTQEAKKWDSLADLVLNPYAYVLKTLALELEDDLDFD